MKISELAQQVRGVTYSGELALEEFKDGYLPILRANNIDDDRINFKKLIYIPVSLVRDRQFLKKDDVLIATSSGSLEIVGKTAIISEDLDMAFGAFCKVLRPNPKVIFPLYFKYFFQTNYYKSKIKSLAGGANINNLRNEHFDDLEIPLPPLHIQKKIAEVLDKADAIRQRNRQILEKYDQLAESLFLEMFGDPVRNEKGWDIKKLAELGKLDRGKSKHRPRGAPELLGGPYPLIQTGDVANAHGYVIEFKSTYSELGLRQSKLWPKGTLCINIAANIGQAAILTFDACFPDSVVGFTPNKLCNTEFILYVFRFLQSYLEKNAPEVARKNINLAILRDIDIPLPPIDMQKEFREQLLKIYEVKSNSLNENLKSEKLFKSLLQKAFKGELFPA